MGKKSKKPKPSKGNPSASKPGGGASVVVDDGSAESPFVSKGAAEASPPCSSILDSPEKHNPGAGKPGMGSHEGSNVLPGASPQYLASAVQGMRQTTGGGTSTEADVGSRGGGGSAVGAPLSPNETSAERPSVADGDEGGLDAAAPKGRGRESADGAMPEDEKRSIDGWRPAIGQMLVGPVPKPKARDAPVRRRRYYADSSDEEASVLNSPAFTRGDVGKAAAAARKNGSMLSKSYCRASTDEDEDDEAMDIDPAEQPGGGGNKRIGSAPPRRRMYPEKMPAADQQLPFGPQGGTGAGDASGEEASESEELLLGSGEVKSRDNSHSLIGPSIFVSWPSQLERSERLSKSPGASTSTPLGRRVAKVLNGSDPEDSGDGSAAQSPKSPFECAIADKVSRMCIDSSDSEEDVVAGARRVQADAARAEVRRHFDVGQRKQATRIIDASSSSDEG